METVYQVIEGVEKSLDSKKRTITSYVSKKTIDRVRDIVNPEGLDETSYRKNPVVLFNHNYDIPVGTNLWLKSNTEGVLGLTRFGSTLQADDVYILNAEGILNAWSIGFIPKAWDFDQENKITTFNKWELLEYSSVSVPANPDAVTEARGMVKSAEVKNYFEKEFFRLKNEQEIKTLLSSMEEIKRDLQELKTKDAVSELKEIITSHQTIVENLLSNFSTQITKSVETLDESKAKEILKDAIVREVSRLKGRVII